MLHHLVDFVASPGWLSSLLVLAGSSLLVIYFQYKNKCNYWKSHGVSGPPPTFLFGHILQIFSSEPMKIQNDWLQKYGKCYGIYFGSKPVLVIADPEVVNQICIQDFDYFPDHAMGAILNEYQKNFVFFQGGNHWKRVRALMTPTFTSAKIKRMFKLLEVCADDLLVALETLRNRKAADGGNVINLKETFGLYTLDGITACCYGLKLDKLNSTDLDSASKHSHLVRAAMRLFEFRKLRVTAAFTLPEIVLKCFGFSIMANDDCMPLAGVVEKILEKRRSNEEGKKFDDYLQILVDAELGDELELGKLDDKENHHAGLTEQSLREDQEKMLNETSRASETPSGLGTTASKLTNIETISSAMFLMAVGLETTSILLTHVSYLLAFHQEIQDKLYDELKKIVNQSSGAFDYSELTSCQYLDAVISEAFRILPPIHRTDRKCQQDYHLKKYNVHIEKGTEVNIFIYSLMNDPDFWHEPEKFNPNRFMPGEREKIVPGSYCPFGLGPRFCLGMRFSLTEAKLALASIVLKYRFKPAPGTCFPVIKMKNVGVPTILNPLAEIHARN